MLRVSFFVLIGLLTATPVSSADADWQDKWHAFCDRVHLDWHRNNCWPAPFTQIDRATICQTFSTQIANGWQRQNTLSDVYFDPDSQVLNIAGQRKVYSILSMAPEQYRTIYVVQSMNPEAQSRRLDSVHQAVSESLSADEPMPEVVSVRISPRTWAADYIEEIERKMQTTIPNPRLPDFQDTTAQ